MNRTGQAVLDGRENVIRRAFINRLERRFKASARDKSDALAEEMDRRFLAEGASVALKSDARVWFHLHSETTFRDLPREPRAAGFSASAVPQPFRTCVRIDSSRMFW